MSEIKVTQEHIDELLEQSEKHVETAFGKVTVVTVKLPNGYSLTESSGCVDKDNYDKELGTQICMEQIEHRLWALEGYLLQTQNYNINHEPIAVSNPAYGTVNFGENTHSYLKFQQGIEPKFGTNGVQVDEVIYALLRRLRYLNECKHDMYNDQTLEYLQKAYNAQIQRNIDREARGVEGTEND